MSARTETLGGATPDQAMTYIAVQEEQDGRAVEFGEKVTDEEYQKGTLIASDGLT